MDVHFHLISTIRHLLPRFSQLLHHVQLLRSPQFCHAWTYLQKLGICVLKTQLGSTFYVWHLNLVKTSKRWKNDSEKRSLLWCVHRLCLFKLSCIHFLSGKHILHHSSSICEHLLEKKKLSQKINTKLKVGTSLRTNHQCDGSIHPSLEFHDDGNGSQKFQN